ncbi:radical SAM protein [Deltaproteobacteria bacterium]|nr:radical SAM protein [Deltaproteobacteria bacterium]
MTWSVKARLRELAAEEIGPSPKEPGGRLTVALVWPGDYRTSLSALGYLSIYGWLNARPEVLAERFFWPEGDLAAAYRRSGAPLLSLESGRPLRDFDLVAASLALENDYWRLPALLSAGGLSAAWSERAEDDPPVLAGGVAVWANPWPVWPFVDLVLTGEAEAQWPQLLSAWAAIRFSPLPKTERLRFLARNTPGSLRPEVGPESPPPLDRRFRGFYPTSDPEPGVSPARLAWPPVGWLPPVAPIVSPQAEFSGVKLVEIGRGCPHGCRFCLAGAIFRPPRHWPLTAILQALGPPAAAGEKVGLVSPAAADHPDLAELLAALFRQNRTVTLSSLSLTAVTPALAEKLAVGRLHGAAVAPEAGSQALRDRLNKALTEEQILAGVRLLGAAGLQKIKLYFMLGLPGETEADLAALVNLVRRIRGEARPFLTLSLANFTPKPHTPLEGAAMNTAAEFRRKGRLVSQALKGLPRLQVNLDPPLWSIAQGLLARGGAESGRLVAALWRHQGRLKPSLAEFGYTPGHPLHQPWPEDGPRPWRIVRPAAGGDWLADEAERARPGRVSPPCPLELNCGRCAACDQESAMQGAENEHHYRGL